jgi:hypothetical protein
VVGNGLYSCDGGQKQLEGYFEQGNDPSCFMKRWEFN